MAQLALRTRWTVAVAAGALVAAAVVAIMVAGGSGKDGRTPRAAPAGITAHDGIRLSAQVWSAAGSGKAPLIVMPASWAATSAEYAPLAQLLARAGYAVIAYTQRGFYNSGGAADFAGPDTTADVSDVITWALRHEPTDRSRIAVMGVSYGAGVGLLAAARDRRIRAVVALSTWTDLGAAFVPNNTLSAGGLGGLLSSAQKTGRLSSELTALIRQFSADRAGAIRTFRLLARARSPIAHVAELNRNRPAIMIANGYQDSLFAPGPLVDFFRGLRTPKRLQLSPGDHTGPEASGINGRANRVVGDARQWLDHYLRDRPNGIERADPVQLQDVISHQWHGYPTWPSTAHSYELGTPDRSADLIPSAAPAPTWSARLRSGVDSPASTRPAPGPRQPYVPPTVAFQSITSARALRWSTAPLPAPVQLAGTPNLTISMTGNPTPVFAYLYDVGPGGSGTLISVAPYTFAGSQRPDPISFALEPIAWTIRAGHRLALVLDTVDPRWPAAAASSPSVITLGSGGSGPAALSVPAPS